MRIRKALPGLSRILEAKKVNHPLSQISKHSSATAPAIRDYLNEAQV